ncbi:MAG: iron ABC transporter permease [Thermoguttaceae bacterium]|nr:iron ABC transporter permease [Thermoguttaceae bacterium]
MKQKFQGGGGEPSRRYRKVIRKKLLWLGAIFLLLPLIFFCSLSWGTVTIALPELFDILTGRETETNHALIVLESRLPQALTAILAGAGLSVSGGVMQAVLRNPLCSPFTLGISSAAAFGAAMVVYLGGGSIAITDNVRTGFFWSQGTVALGAFLSSLLAVVIVLALARLRRAKTETVILIGVALSAFYGAGIMLLQYVADEQQLSAMVYWSFGDTARGTWRQISFLTPAILLISGWFFLQSWHYNTLSLGEETARGLGVPVRRLCGWTMFWASLLTAILVSSLGVIGFVGLVVPHLTRLLTGSDYRFVLPFSMFAGATLLLVSDTVARLIFLPRIMPVSILTAFLGGPVFLILLLCRRESAS